MHLAPELIFLDKQTTESVEISTRYEPRRPRESHQAHLSIWRGE